MSKPQLKRQDASVSRIDVDMPEVEEKENSDSSTFAPSEECIANASNKLIDFLKHNHELLHAIDDKLDQLLAALTIAEEEEVVEEKTPGQDEFDGW